ncbi:stage II sporulation protein E [Romboutsia sp. Marseille-P6047]|uniref:stage II sporulation protein E n=1 Tax=Romboutsia sp. Marseille-P6047 TaxID=2161817 RepID=UPI000F04E6DB|nr:stage II sporulation protein E [Romboutsia sp. Marseille-P6047]
MEKTLSSLKRKHMSLNNLGISRFVDANTIVFIIMGFLLSRSILIDSIAPLGLAFFICISKFDRYKYPVFVSTLLGIISSGNDTGSIFKYSIALVTVLLISSQLKKVPSILKVSIVGMFILLATSIGQALIGSKYIYDLLLIGMEAVLLFIFIYTFTFGVSLIINCNNRASVRLEEAISISLLVTFSIMGIGSISAFGVSIRSVLSTMLILIAAIVGGSAMGATSGVVVGVAFIINNITSAVYMGIYSFAGLVGGAFTRLNKYFCILGYILSWIIMYSYTSGISSNIMEIRDILISSLIVILLPKSFFDKIDKLVKSNISSNEIVYDYINRSKKLTNSRLMDIQKTYSELANTFDKIRERDKVIEEKDITNLIDMIHNDECANCSMKRMCWETRFNHTYKLMYRLIENIEDYGEATPQVIPDAFRKECMKPEVIAKVANYYYKLFALDYDWNAKFAESRKLIANQIRNISKSIENLSKDLETNISIDLEKEKGLCDEFERNNIDINKINYLTKGDDFEITIEKRTCSNGYLCDKKLKSIVENCLDEKLSIQKVGCHTLGSNCTIKLTKAQVYKAITEVAYMSRDGYVLSGDNYTYMEVSDGKYIMAISDGMGKGKRAYDESSVTIDILEKMIEARIENEIVINTINNMLLLKSSDEMFSTLDLGMIDLKKGVMETVKMGACPSYIKRDNGDVDLISSSSLPVGILSDVKMDRHRTKINNGDYIIMVSDGIIDAGKSNNFGDNWLIYFLQKIDSTNPKEIANKILDRALELQLGEVEDDMTVLVTRVIS